MKIDTQWTDKVWKDGKIHVKHLKVMSKIEKEADLQTRICNYLRMNYPKVEFRTDKDGQFAYRSQLRYKKAHAGKRGFPDIIISEPNKEYKGLVIELKREGAKIFRMDGSIRKNWHLEDQQYWLDWFKTLGCYSTFSIGYDQTVDIINKYLNNR